MLTDHVLCYPPPPPPHAQIPHYNLPIATKAIKSYLKEHDLDWMYKSDNTWDFVFRTHKYFLDFGFKSHRSASGAVEARKQLKESKGKGKGAKAH